MSHRDELMSVLVSQGYLSNDIISQAIAEHLKVPYVDLRAHDPKKELLLEVPEDIARKFRVIVFEKDKKDVSVATDDPANPETEKALSKVFPGLKMKLFFAGTITIDEMLTRYNQSLQERFTEICKKTEHVAPALLDAIFSDAVAAYASDIHFEPYLGKVLVRFRVDGVLRDMAFLEKAYYDNVLNRIKVSSNIRLDMHAKTQDGSMQFVKDSIKIDLRTSIIPTIEGEKVVMRVLSSYVKGLGLEDIGFSKENQKLIYDAANKPFGMIIVTGPTGSGKSTTLYSLLKILNKEDVNITTIEDPVEYKMKGLNQIQVNSFANLTFAQGLRSIVRQDPDIILVGEIRDEETAEIAVNAALTGHLLFSTFHANDAATTIPRLLNMRIQPYLLASTLELVVAQRLVRTICPKCKYSVDTDTKTICGEHPGFEHFFPEKELTLFAGKGCPACGNSGYKGRSAIFEFIHITPAMQDLITTSPSTQEIWELARKEGARTLFEDGIDKVKNGVTTLDELLRVAEAPKDILQKKSK